MSSETNILLNSESDFSYMERLSDDCLVKIFEHLPIVDRIRFEAVSKRWKTLIECSWSNLKHLTFRDKRIWTHSKKDFKRAVNDKIFKNLLSRFGRYLISLDLGSGYYVENKLTLDSLPLILQFCPKLTALSVCQIFDCTCNCCKISYSISDSCKFQPKRLQTVQMLKDWKCISSLKKFGLKVCLLKPDVLSSLVAKMENVESLHFAFGDYGEYCEAPHLSVLPLTGINEIIFEFCEVLDEALLIKGVKKMPNLRTAILTDLRSYNFLRHLQPSQCEALQNLHVTLGVKYTTEELEDDIKSFQRFSNLKRLNLTDNNCTLVVDEFLEALGKYCKELIFLNISDQSEVSDSGIKHIVSLPKLKYLLIQGLHNVKGKTLNAMPNLEVLDCYGCPYLEDEGLCAIVRQSKLKVLNIGKCCTLTNQVLDTVCKELINRTERADLIFMIKDSKLKIDQVEIIPPQLRIVESYQFLDSDSEYFRVRFPK